jgi:hypothetical protein
MSSLPAPRPAPNGSRHRKPQLPVQLLRVTCEAGLADLIAGHAVLAITTGDDSDCDTRVYWLRADVAHSGKIVSFELTTFAKGAKYELPADLASCSCPDGIYREERPGGCKHAAALRHVLLGMSQGTPWAGFDSDADVRDDVLDGAAHEEDEVIDLNQRWTLAG